MHTGVYEYNEISSMCLEDDFWCGAPSKGKYKNVICHNSARDLDLGNEVKVQSSRNLTWLIGMIDLKYQWIPDHLQGQEANPDAAKWNMKWKIKYDGSQNRKSLCH